MVNLRTFASFTYLMQAAFPGGNAQTDGSRLQDIVPKREVLYVGGDYANITASHKSHEFQGCLSIGTRILQPTPYQRLW
jgi:hypothetical protein